MLYAFVTSYSEKKLLSPLGFLQTMFYVLKLVQDTRSNCLFFNILHSHHHLADRCSLNNQEFHNILIRDRHTSLCIHHMSKHLCTYTDIQHLKVGWLKFYNLLDGNRNHKDSLCSLLLPVRNSCKIDQEKCRMVKIYPCKPQRNLDRSRLQRTYIDRQSLLELPKK